ncbi:orotate phosphoribosyltransferase [Candidatus Woesearchaeota archaeon]|nr:orotate phosphoribosyltransferase [Candidatus Woesearchaeota archaeon]|tara:strand:- start:1034 stop:1705 length:672 start_codon:yes stop_codon:yes gene_type:complete
METYKKEFIKFLVRCDALKFGEFKLKSGRIAQYFINTGMFNDGEKIKKLGEYYASAIIEHFGKDFDAVYGPAYKGIPLCITTSIGLQKEGINKGYVFNRKLIKDYGMEDNLIGTKVDKKSSLILVDDVITSGKAIRESLEILKKNGNPKVKGIVISVDRQEKGTTEKNALRQIAEDLGIPIFSIVKLKDIIEVLYNKEIDGKIFINEEIIGKINNYIEQYGAE